METGAVRDFPSAARDAVPNYKREGAGGVSSVSVYFLKRGKKSDGGEKAETVSGGRRMWC